MNILITGFELFGDHTKNVSGEVAELVSREMKEENKVDIEHLVLPVTKDAHEPVFDHIENGKTDLILMTGINKNATEVMLERFALNCLDFKIPDNNGQNIQESTIDEDGAHGYKTKIPLRPLCEHLEKKGHNVSISNSAGTYICNYVYYMTNRLLDTLDKDTNVLFVHFPPNSDVRASADLCKEIVGKHR